MDAAAAAVAGIPMPSSELQIHQDGQIITETTVTSDTGDLMVGMSAADNEVGALLSADQIPIMAAGSHIAQPDVEISPEDELRSNERLDRSSPDLWPQNCKITAFGSVLPKISNYKLTLQMSSNNLIGFYV